MASNIYRPYMRFVSVLGCYAGCSMLMQCKILHANKLCKELAIPYFENIMRYAMRKH